MKTLAKITVVICSITLVTAFISLESGWRPDVGIDHHSPTRVFIDSPDVYTDSLVHIDSIYRDVMMPSTKSAYMDFAPLISKDSDTLYFRGSRGDADIYLDTTIDLSEPKRPRIMHSTKSAPIFDDRHRKVMKNGEMPFPNESNKEHPFTDTTKKTEQGTPRNKRKMGSSKSLRVLPPDLYNAPNSNSNDTDTSRRK